MAVIEAEMQEILVTAEMTTIDRAELGRYEAVIGRGLQTFVEVGDALAAIRDGELYRGTHATFLGYCRERWDIGKSQVYRLMSAAEVAGNLDSPMGESGERVLRPLTKLNPDQQRAAWTEAVESALAGKPTAAVVEKAVAKFAEPRPLKAKPALPMRSPASVIENMIEVWLHNIIGERGLPTPDSVLDMLVMQTKERYKPGSWLEILSLWLTEMAVMFDTDGLARAIGAVRKRRRTAARQDQARAVYVEPTPDPEEAAQEPIETMPLPNIILYKHLIDAGFVLEALLVNGDRRTRWAWPADGFRGPWAYAPSMALQQALDWYEQHEHAVEATVEEAAAIAEVEAERAEEDAERLAREAQRAEDERIEDEDDHYTARGGILSRAWIMDTLIGDDPAHAYYASALSGATVDDLREALASLSTEDKYHKARLAALMVRLDELESVPAMSMVSPSLLHPSPIVAALIDPATPVTTTEVGGLNWAVGEATATQLNEALVLMSDALRVGRGPVLAAALKKRGGVKAMMAEKQHDARIDPRLGKAKAMIAALVYVRQQARDDYGDLTGRHCDLLAFERSIEAMLEPLGSFVEIFEKGYPNDKSDL